MCGLAGFVDLNNSVVEHRLTVERMADNIVHRGPDDSGSWVSENQQVAMSFRRLSIIDLSPSGHQPMVSNEGRWVICFNGEIYNFLDLRRELKEQGGKFSGNSDTEVILVATQLWGVEEMIARINGMFAISIFDQMYNVLYLVRDRFGVKPLYYGWPECDDQMVSSLDGFKTGSAMFFGSEMKALRGAWKHAPSIDKEALHGLLNYQYVPGDRTLWKGIRQLSPGHMLTINLSNKQANTKCYWSAGKILEDGSLNPLNLTDAHAIDALSGEIDKAVSRRMISDVPLGAFLSGGIDSAIVVSSMQKYSSTPVKTFTIGSEDRDLDESKQAARVAKHLGTDHHEMIISDREAQEVVLNLGEIADEPLGDAAFIPGYIVSKFARESVTVALSGDGGDELFAGYPQHRFAPKVWPMQRYTPEWFASLAKMVCLDPSHTNLRKPLVELAAILRRDRYKGGHSAGRVAKLLRVAGEKDRALFMSKWRELVINPNHFLADSEFQKSSIFHPDFNYDSIGSTRLECWADSVRYMPDDILLKVDRASMAASLEAREPLLDTDLYQFASRLSDEHLLKGKTGKWILRQVLHQRVPANLVEGPKKGFAVPVGGWITGPLRDWAENLLDPKKLRDAGHFNADAIGLAWKNLCGDQQSQENQMPLFGIWSVLAFQAWHERWN